MTIRQANRTLSNRNIKVAVVRERVWFWFVAPGVLILIGVVVVPAVRLIVNSLYQWNILTGVRRFDGLGQYETVLADTLFIGSIVRTLVFTVAVVITELLLGLLVATLLARDFRGARLARTAFLTPMLMIPVVVGLLWSLMYQPSIGIVNYLFHIFGIPPALWLSSQALALPAIGIAEVWQWTPFATMVFVAAMRGLPANVLAAADLDGTRRLRRLLTIEVPMMRKVILVVFLLRFIDVFKTFALVFIMTRGGPGHATVLAGYYPWEVGFSEFDMGKASAAAFILLNLITILTYFLIRPILREREA